MVNPTMDLLEWLRKQLVGTERVNRIVKLTEREKPLLPLPFGTPGFGHANIYRK